mmetsp:Transcript_28363/g.48148  ORF Transcript_28363/g.48148 Transcript_28363/m.48148 type:complete len:285 (+) Transcript_28363:3184-4038(+)
MLPPPPPAAAPFLPAVAAPPPPFLDLAFPAAGDLVLREDDEDFFVGVPVVSFEVLEAAVAPVLLASDRRSPVRYFPKIGSKDSFSAFLKFVSFPLTYLNPITSTQHFKVTSDRERTSPIRSRQHFKIGITNSFISDFFNFSFSKTGFRALNMSLRAFVCSNPFGMYGTNFARPAALMHVMRVRIASSRICCFLSAKQFRIASITTPMYFPLPDPIASTTKPINFKAWIIKFLFLSDSRNLSALNAPPSLPLMRQFAPLTMLSISSIASFLNCHFLSPSLDKIPS